MIPLSRKAEIALHALQPDDMKRVVESIEMLNMYPEEPFLSNRIKKVTALNDLYILRVTSDLRIIFQMIDSTKEITDIVRHSRLEKMFGHNKKDSIDERI